MGEIKKWIDVSKRILMIDEHSADFIVERDLMADKRTKSVMNKRS